MIPAATAQSETINSDVTSAMAVVVICVGAARDLVDAVRSLLDQTEIPEIIVVNSGGGNASQLLLDHGIDVPVIDLVQRQFAGGARNIGIAATKAPFVAFLASDCRAEKDWVALRIRRHKEGMCAVASALLPCPIDNKYAWASHLALYVRRLPQNSRLTALLYGASYSRNALTKYGDFDASLRTSEDTEYLSRMQAEERPKWDAKILTYHKSPTGLVELLRDQFARGRRASRQWADLPDRGSIWDLMARRKTDPQKMATRLRIAKDPQIEAALRLMGVCAAAYSAGLLVGLFWPAGSL